MQPEPSRPIRRSPTPAPAPRFPAPQVLRIHVQSPPDEKAGPDAFPVPITQVRRAIVRSYARGIYDSGSIARTLAEECSRREGGRPVRVDSGWIRTVRQRDRSTIESDLAATLAGSPRSGRFLTLLCLAAARERVRLAMWLDRATSPRAARELRAP